MSCSAYYSYSPYGILCNSMNAIVGGLIGGEILQEKITYFINNYAPFLKEDFSSGRSANQFFEKFFREIDLSKGLNLIIEQIDKAIASGIDKSKFDENIGVLGKKIREAIFKEVNGAVDDTTGVFGEAAKGVAIKMIPWIALSGALLVGAPLATHYFYKKAVHSIGRPKLAGEVRYVGLYNRVTDLGASSLNNIWKCVKPGLQWTAGSAVLGYVAASAIVAGCIGGAVIGSLTDKKLVADQLNEMNFLSRFSINLAFGLPEMIFSKKSEIDSSFYKDRVGAVATFALSCVGLGASVTVLHALKLFKESFRDIGKKAPKAYFNEEVTEIIKNFTTATTNTKKHGGYFQNLLLYGPGGTGKTMISQIIARNSGVNYVMMSGGDLAQYIKRGEHVTELNKLFDDAKNSFTPTIITIDECESMCRDRDKMDKQELIELLNAFLNQTGVPSRKVILVLITNRMEDLDEAVLSRMDYKVFIGPPEKSQRIEILQEYAQSFFSRFEVNQFFSLEDLEKIAEQVNGFTGRTIFKLMNAIQGKKFASNNNRLTNEIIDSTVKQFVDQETRVETQRAKKQAAKGLLNSDQAKSPEIVNQAKPDRIKAQNIKLPNEVIELAIKRYFEQEKAIKALDSLAKNTAVSVVVPKSRF